MLLMFSEGSLLLLDPKVRGELGKGEKLEVLDTTSELPNALGIQLVCTNHRSSQLHHSFLESTLLPKRTVSLPLVAGKESILGQ